MPAGAASGVDGREMTVESSAQRVIGGMATSCCVYEPMMSVTSASAVRLLTSGFAEFRSPW